MTLAAPDRTILYSYLDRGFALFPVWSLRPGGVCACPKGPEYTNPDKTAKDAHAKHPHGKHPLHKLVPNGFKNASRDKAIVTQWSRSAPDCNWGLATGEPLPGGGFLLVLDEDPRNGGDETLKSIVAMQGPLPATPAADTGGNGGHYLFRTEKPLASFSIGPGLETRGAGGYIVVEPSVHTSGGSYTWRIGLGIEDLRIADAPAWLVEAGGGVESSARPVREGEGTARDTILGEAFALSGMLGAPLPDGRIAVQCPWAAEHSDARGHGQDTSTVILPPAGGRMFGGFSCKHGHCSNRKWTDVLAELPKAHVEAARRKFPLRPVVVTDDAGEAKVTMAPAPESVAANRKALFERCNFKESKAGGYKLTNDPVNVVTILTHAEEWKGVLAFDEFSQVVRFTKDPPWFDDDAPGIQTYVWSDADAFRLVLWFKRALDLDVKDTLARQAAITVAFQNTVNPLTAWLDTLAWDKTPRLTNWLSTYLGAEETEYSKVVGPKWCISAIARAYEAGVKCDHVIILQGKQGVGKSTALATLAGRSWFSDTPLDLSSKDSYLALNGRWIIELAELASMKRTEVERAKAFFSSPTDTYRPPYGREVAAVPRRCVFAGSVNETTFLNDSTGGRRFWPVMCGVIDTDGLKADREQLWAEAKHRYRLGETWHPETQDQRDLATAVQDECEVGDAWVDPIREWLADSKAWDLYVKHECLRSIDITERALAIRASDLSTVHATRVASAMRQMGWRKTRRRVDGVRYYAFTHPSWDLRALSDRKR